MIASVDEGSDTWRWVERADCGICAKPEDPEGLGDAIRTLYSDLDLREHLARNAREHVVAHYIRQVVARQYHELLTAVVH